MKQTELETKCQRIIEIFPSSNPLRTCAVFHISIHTLAIDVSNLERNQRIQRRLGENGKVSLLEPLVSTFTSVSSPSSFCAQCSQVSFILLKAEMTSFF